MLDDLYSRPGFLLRRAHQLSVAIFENACRPVHLTPSQYAVLVVLHENRTCNQNQLALALGMSKVTISQTVKALIERSLVISKPLETDKRQNVLSMTAEGEQLLHQSQMCTQEAYGQLMGPLQNEEREQLLFLLKKITTSLECCAKSAWKPISN